MSGEDAERREGTELLLSVRKRKGFKKCPNISNSLHLKIFCGFPMLILAFFLYYERYVFVTQQQFSWIELSRLNGEECLGSAVRMFSRRRDGVGAKVNEAPCSGG